MGCDIHGHVEQIGPDGWREVVPVPDVWDFRSYSVFGWLAGVRNYSAVEPIQEPRGFPADACPAVREDFEKWEMDAHSASWLYVSELLAIDYDSEVNDCRVTRQVGPNAFDGGCTGDPGEGESKPLREFLGQWFMDKLDVLAGLGEPNRTRVVFWFDN